MLVPALLLAATSTVPAPLPETSISRDPAFLLAVSMPLPAADVPEMEYTYVEANYLWTDSDAAGESLDGLELIGSLELPLNFFGQVSVSRQSSDADLNLWKIGAGYHLPVGSRLDAFGILSVAGIEVEDSGSDFDDTGMAAELGLRMLVTSKIEVNGSGVWLDLDDEDDYGLKLGARYYITDFLSLGGRVESVDSDESFAAGVRFEF